MKKTRRLPALLLALVMVFSCLPLNLFAADKLASVNTAASQKAQLGFKSMSFRENNTYCYQANELVRAVIVMDGEPAGAVTGNRAPVRAKLAAQHDTLRKGIKDISYTELFEYDSLLNGLAVETAYGNLDAIAAMPGVKAVYIANHYALPVYEVKMESSNEMTGLATAHAAGFTGSGTVIAILDTGMTAGHDAFAVYDGMLESAAISKTDAKAFISGKGYGKYVSQKIPFSYDYADGDNIAEDTTSGHGPHVAGIAAGYAEAADGAVTFMGAAPDAQLLEMKIFGDSESGTSSDVYFAALEDAYELGADVISMSIGAQNGFTYDTELENDVYGNIYEILDRNGIVCSISAGNEDSVAANASNRAGAGYATADYADYGVLGAPSIYDGNLSIASLENAAFPAYVLKCGNLEIPYYDSDANSQFYKAMAGMKLNFVDCGYGYAEDFEGVDVENKIALISRGDITFQEKVNNAAAAGAVAAIVYNNTDGIIYMSIDSYAIPAAAITQADGRALLAVLADSEAEETESIRATRKAARGDYVEMLTAQYAATPNDGSAVVLYSAADGVIMAYSAEYEDDGEYLTWLNQNTEAATLSGDKLTFDWVDAGILYAIDMEDGTWAFIDEYEYDNNSETYLLYNDGTFIGTLGHESDGDYVFYELIASGDGYKFKNVGSKRYLVIENGLFRDTEDEDGATVLSFFSFDNGSDNPPVDIGAPVITFPKEKCVIANPDGWQMSDYSSRGCTPSLTLKPLLTGVGGDVNSVAYNSTDDYAVYSGTSMSAPNVSGYMAVLLSALKQRNAEQSKAERANMAEAIAESTAMALTDADGNLYSPRKQGAGLIDITAALNAGAYIEDPIQNLYDNTDGVFEFTFTVTSFSDSDETFKVVPYVLYDRLTSVDWGTEDASDVHYYNTLTSDVLSGEGCTVEAPEQVTVAAGKSTEITVRITLADATKAYFDEYYPNGNFIEGYIFLKPEAEAAAEIHATYMGFYGDWTKAPIMEQHDWREIVDAETWLNTTKADAEGNTYADCGYTYFDIADFEVNTDINLVYSLNAYYLALGQVLGGYAGDNLFAYTEFNEKHIAISEGEDGICDVLYMMPMCLRNCRHMIMVVSDAKTGEVYHVDDTEYVRKAIYVDDGGYWYNDPLIWGGTDADGNTVANDTVADINYYCNLAYGEDTLGAIDYEDLKTEGEAFLEWSFQCTVDNEAPEFTYYYDAKTETLTVTATDNQYVAYICVLEDDEIIAGASFSEDKAGKTVTATFKGISDDVAYEIDVADYATNIAAEDAVLEDADIVTVNFSFPEGCVLDGMEITTEVPVGASIKLPTLYGDVNGGHFTAWIPSELDGIISYGELYSDDYEYLWNEIHLDGEQYTVTKAVTFHALFERPNSSFYDPHEKLTKCAVDWDDWSGIWAIDGHNWSAGGSITDYLLSSDLTTSAIAPKTEKDEHIEDDYFGDSHLYNALDGHLFEIEKVGADDSGKGIYTIKTADGKYLALNQDGKLLLADEAADEYATWDISFFAQISCNLVWNRGVDFLLAFDERTNTIDSIDAEYGIFVRPNNLYLFGPSAISYEYFTTAPQTVCEHRNTEIRAASAATCTAKGYTGDTYCTDCGMKIAGGTPIPALGHDLITDEAVPATCTEPGLTAGVHCTRCDYAVAQETVNALGHDLVTDEAVPATCTEPGLTAGVHCTRCDYAVAQESVNALGHAFFVDEAVPATCTEPGLTVGIHCARCDYVIAQETVEALGHNYVDGVCSRCGEADPDYAAECPTKDYTDVPDESNWAHVGIDYCVANGYMGSTGTAELTFEPNTKVSRAMVASIMYRIAGSPENVEYKGSFTDVPEGKWFTTAIEWCAQNGLAAGKGNGRFDPSGNVTRQELAVFMYKLVKYLGCDVDGVADLSAFPDYDKVPSWAAPYLAWAVDDGIISGKASNGKTYLAPNDTATRAELASIIMRFIEKHKPN